MTLENDNWPEQSTLEAYEVLIVDEELDACTECVKQVFKALQRNGYVVL